MTFLYENINALRQYNHIAPIPNYISANLNPNFELRPYQIQAFENFITHFECPNRPNPLQVLFHMATGSGKTLIMAGLMLYLYQQGYRNFLFFVNLTNIVEKTKDNFLNTTSPKYLFANEIVLDGRRIRINQVYNFQQSDKDAINICFATTQGLHLDMWMTKENGMSFDDFENQKVVLLSDEAHHLNVLTQNRRNANDDDEHIRTWEQTVDKILNKNSDNILLEFTATCNLSSPCILSAYENKIVFNYTLTNFYDDKYSKDIETLMSDADRDTRVLQALILSQYRLKVFQYNRLSIKPIILFKSKKVSDSQTFFNEFKSLMNNLTPRMLEGVSKNSSRDSVLGRAFKYFKEHELSYENLANELREEFSEKHCLSVNNDNDALNMQLTLNSLENSTNPYRAIFEVRKLDEGWDVLNLFDIVRLYETSTPNETISEAQLIGRGARYCPFKLTEEQPKYQRKYDYDVGEELRVCETLYYHCQNDNKYISNLKSSLREIGLDIDRVVKREYRPKENFRASSFYNTGKVFCNSRVPVSRSNVNELLPSVRDALYNFHGHSNYTNTDSLMTANNQFVLNNSTRTKRISIGEISNINYNIVHRALRQYPIFCFNVLKSYFPNLTSTRDFIQCQNYLGGVHINIESPEETLSTRTMYRAVLYVVGRIADALSRTKVK